MNAILSVSRLHRTIHSFIPLPIWVARKQCRSILYIGFITLEECPAQQDPEQINLHSPTSKVQRPWPVKNTKFFYDFDDSQIATEISVVSINDPEIGLRVPVQLDRLRRCTVDLSEYPDGRYTLLLDNHKKLDFILNKYPTFTPWGFIEIFTSTTESLVPETNCIIGSNGVVQPKSFNLSLATQRSIWRYIVVPSPTGQQDHPPDIRLCRILGTRGTTFNEPVQTDVNGRDAWVFQSKTPIGLYAQARDGQTFRLLGEGQADDNDGISLPAGRAQDTHAVPENSCAATTPITKIFVYL